MKQVRQTADVQEPMGIIIAGGTQPEVAPRFAAYVWGPAPVEAEHEAPKAAA